LFLVRRVGLRERGAITHARHPRTARFSSLDPSFGRYFQSEYFNRDRGAGAGGGGAAAAALDGATGDDMFADAERALTEARDPFATTHRVSRSARVDRSINASPWSVRTSIAEGEQQPPSRRRAPAALLARAPRPQAAPTRAVTRRPRRCVAPSARACSTRGSTVTRQLRSVIT